MINIYNNHTAILPNQKYLNLKIPVLKRSSSQEILGERRQIKIRKI